MSERRLQKFMNLFTEEQLNWCKSISIYTFELQQEVAERTKS